MFSVKIINQLVPIITLVILQPTPTTVSPQPTFFRARILVIRQIPHNHQHPIPFSIAQTLADVRLRVAWSAPALF